MKLKIKVKTLIVFILLSLFLVLIIVPIGNLEIARYLNEKDSNKAEAFYKNYISSPIKTNERQGLYGYGESLIKGIDKYKIRFSGRSGGENTTPESMEKAIELFEMVLLKGEKKDYKDEYSTKSYLKLLDTSIATLDIDKLLYWIEWGRDKENEEIKYMSKLYKAYYHFVQKDYDIAKETLEDFNDEELDIKYYQLMGDVNLHLGNVEKAKEYYEAPGKSGFWARAIYFGSYFGGSSFLGQYEIEEYIKRFEGDYKIKGRVSNNGKGLPFVQIYISSDIGQFSTGGEKPDAITDKNGEFETLGFKQGIYNIGIGIHPSQLYNKVYLSKDIWSIELNSDIEFDFDFTTPIEITGPKDKMVMKDGENLQISWDPVEGADYYEVELVTFSNPGDKRGSSGRILLKDRNGDVKLKDNSMIFNTENLDERITIITFSGEEGIINPTAIFSSLILKVEYPLIVNAYDKESTLISSSLPLISDYSDIISMSIKGELTKGEKLILDKKYEEAILYYEERLIQNLKDKESLLYLIRFYEFGWKMGKKDILKALRYAEEYGREYKDYKLSLEVVDFMSQKGIKENKDRVKRILDKVPEEDRDTNYYRNMAMYYLAEEDYLKARGSYEKMTDSKYRDIIYIDIYLGDYEKAISTLESGEITLFKMNKRKVIEGLNNMSNLSENDKALFKKLLKSELDKSLNREEKNTLYNKTLNSVSSLELRNVIKEIGKEENWDIEY